MYKQYINILLVGIQKLPMSRSSLVDGNTYTILCKRSQKLKITTESRFPSTPVPLVATQKWVEHIPSGTPTWQAGKPTRVMGVFY